MRHTGPSIQLLASSLAMVIAGVTSGAGASHVVWSQPWNSTWDAPPSIVTTRPAASTELADDFEVNGTIERIVVSGNDCFQCAPPIVAGVWVRFYEWTESGPGELQFGEFVNAGSDNLIYSPTGPAGLDITLTDPFFASGKHFVSVQLSIAGWGFWGWWVSNLGSPNGSHFYSSPNGAAWEGYLDVLGNLENADLAFMLWGDDGNPPPPGTDPCGVWQPTPIANPAGATHAIVRDIAVSPTGERYAVGHFSALVNGSNQTYSMFHVWTPDGNGGGSWALVSSPSPTACPSCTYATFDAVTVVAPDDIWAAGGKRVQAPDGFLGTQVFVARWNGSSWTVMNTPLTSGGSGSHIADIVAVSPDDIWFFGEQAGTFPNGGQSTAALAMHWDGSSFSIVTTPFPGIGTPGFGLEAGSALSTDEIWAVGGGSDGDPLGGKTYIIRWNGSSWQKIDSPAPGTFNRLYDVIAIASDDVWVVGDYFVAGQTYFPFFLHWDGSSFTQVTSPGGSRGLLAFSSDNIYCVGGGIVRWDGSSWSLVEDFDQVIGPSTLAIAGDGLCGMSVVGRQLVAGQLMPFAAEIITVPVGEFTEEPVDPADLDGDGAVDGADLGLLLSTWGECESCEACPADLTGDCVVDGADLGALLSAWTG